MAGGGGAPAPKIDEPQPHPPKDQLPNVSYCITSPPPWREFSFFCFSVIIDSISVCSCFEPDSSAIFIGMFYIFKSMLCL